MDNVRLGGALGGVEIVGEDQGRREAQVHLPQGLRHQPRPEDRLYSRQNETRVLVEEAFDKLKKEFDECQIDTSDKAMVVLQKNLRTALERKRAAVLRTIELAQQLVAEWKSFRPSLCSPRSRHQPDPSRDAPREEEKVKRKGSPKRETESLNFVTTSAADDTGEIGPEGEELPFIRHCYSLQFNNRFSGMGRRGNQSYISNTVFPKDAVDKSRLQMSESKGNRMKALMRVESFCAVEDQLHTIHPQKEGFEDFDRSVEGAQRIGENKS